MRSPASATAARPARRPFARLWWLGSAISVLVLGGAGAISSGTSGATSGPAQPSTSAAIYSEVVGFPLYATGNGQSTISMTPGAVGDLIVAFVELHSGSSPAVTRLSAPNVNWQSSPTVINTDASVPLHLETWYGVATSTSSGLTTVTYSGSVTTNGIEIIVDSFHYGSAGTWTVAQAGSQDGPSSTVGFPALKSASASAGGGGGGVYVGYSRLATSFTSGSTAGFTYYVTPRANVELRSVTLGASTTYSPVASQSGSGEYTSDGAIFYVAGGSLSPPTVTAISPATGPTAGGTHVTVAGTGFSTGDTVTFGPTRAAAVTLNSSTSISATSPPGTGTVDVTVTGPGGTSVKSSADTFTYANPVPTVTSVSPLTGPVGTRVTIVGTGFSTGDVVTFGTARATGLTVNSATSITTTSPSGTGTVSVTVTGPGGTSAVVSSDEYTYTTPVPTVTSVSPATGPAGTKVTIAGTGFSTGDTVTFGTTRANGAVVNSSTSISVPSPVTTGTVDVTVTGAGGTSATSPADKYTYTTGPPPPYIEAAGFPRDFASSGLKNVSLSPHSVGDLVVLFVELHSGSSPSVSGLSAANINWQHSAAVVNTDATVPLHVETWFGIATSTATATTTINYSGSVMGNSIEIIADSFHYGGSGTWTVAAGGQKDGSSSTVGFPLLTSSAGSAGGGQGGIYVGYSRVASNYVSGSTTGFSYYETPKGNVEVSDAALGDSTSYAPAAQQSATAEYTSDGAIFYVASGTVSAPTVTSVSPPTGPTVGGTKVTITGTGFSTGDTVTFGAAHGTDVVVGSTTSITVTSPAGAGTVNVTVTGAGGTSATSPSDSYTYTTPRPTVTSVSPPTGPTAGGTKVTITGTGFSTGDTVTFGTAKATVAAMTSPTSITATSPTGTGTVDVTVSGPGGRSVTNAGDKFTFTNTKLPTGITHVATSEKQTEVATGVGYTTHAVGDIVLLEVKTATTSAHPTRVSDSSGRIAWTSSRVAGSVVTTTSWPVHLEIWWGRVTSAGTTTVNVTWTGRPPGGTGTWLQLDAFRSAAGSQASWVLVGASSGAVSHAPGTYAPPIITSAGGTATQFYWTKSEASGSSSVNTSAYTRFTDGHGNGGAYKLNLAASTGYSAKYTIGGTRLAVSAVIFRAV